MNKRGWGLILLWSGVGVFVVFGLYALIRLELNWPIFGLACGVTAIGVFLSYPALSIARGCLNYGCSLQLAAPFIMIITGRVNIFLGTLGTCLLAVGLITRWLATGRRSLAADILDIHHNQKYAFVQLLSLVILYLIGAALIVSDGLQFGWNSLVILLLVGLVTVLLIEVSVGFRVFSRHHA